MSKKGSPTLIIYLDQNAWIELAKIYFKVTPTDEEKVVLDKIQLAVSKNRAIFPITFTNYDEALRIKKIQRRKKLAYYIFKISQGYSFQPWINKNIEMEVINLVLKKLNLPSIYMKNLILDQGISNLMGGRATLLPNPLHPLPKDVLTQLEILTESIFALNYILNVAPARKCDVKKSDIRKLEKNRKLLSKIKDKKSRYRAFLLWNISSLLTPIFAEIIIKWNLPADFFIRKGITEEEILALLDAIPTALCFFTLIYQRDQLADRNIEANDFNDIWFLSLSIPYSDIVVTEKLWKTICHGSKLDLKCNTKIFSSIFDLLPFL